MGLREYELEALIKVTKGWRFWRLLYIVHVPTAMPARKRDVCNYQRAVPYSRDRSYPWAVPALLKQATLILVDSRLLSAYQRQLPRGLCACILHLAFTFTLNGL